jgi:hypothetical protein
MDYVDKLSYQYNIVNKELLESLLSIMEKETELLILTDRTQYVNENSYNILVEALADSIKEFIQKIIEFLKRIFLDYETKAKKMTETFKKWYSLNKDNLEKVDYTKMTVTIFPYWLGNVEFRNIPAEIGRMDELISFIATNKSEEDINNKFGEKGKRIESLVNKFTGSNRGDDFTLKMKRHFRSSNADVDDPPITISGDKLDHVIHAYMIIYCNTYLTDTVRKLKAQLARVEGLLKKVETQTQATAEGYCLIEECSYDRTDIIYAKNYILLEAAPAPAVTDKPDTQVVKAPAKPVVVVNKDDKVLTKNTEDTKTVNKENYDKLAVVKDVVNYLKLLISAAMTVGEEKFNSYFSALQQISNVKTVAKPEEKKEVPKEEKK